MQVKVSERKAENGGGWMVRFMLGKKETIRYILPDAARFMVINPWMISMDHKFATSFEEALGIATRDAEEQFRELA